MNTSSTQKTSNSDEVPIPTAHTRGRTTRLDSIQTQLKNRDLSYSIYYRLKHSRICFLAFLLLIPSFLSTPEPVLAISQINISTKTILLPSHAHYPDHWEPTLISILEHEVSRHNILNNDWISEVDSYIDMVKQIESDGKRTAYNPSGAMSYFQFKPESVKTAHYRLLNYMRRHDLGPIPVWSRDLYYNPQHIYATDANKQAVLMIINLIELDHEVGTDLFANFLAGDREAGIQAYYKYHHTAPDTQTIRRTERIFAQHFR